MKASFPSQHLAASLLASLALLAGMTGCREHFVPLVAGDPGGTLETPQTLVTAFPILNKGRAAANNVQVTAISYGGASLTAPGALPLTLGNIAADASRTVFATFTSSSFAAGSTQVMKVEGRYTEGGHPHKFAVERPLRIEPGSPGSAAASAASSPPNVVSGGHFPHQPPHFPSEVNEGHAWTVPVGVIHTPGTPSMGSGAQPAPHSDPPGIDFFTNASLGISSSSVNEPSGGVGGGGSVVFTTANWFAAYSTNSGGSFTQLDPTTIFPNNADGGFCCDQVVQYAQSIDRVIWLMQFSQGSGSPENRYRIAAASPATIQSSNGTNWTYWDITSTQLGSTDWLDYPDLSVGNNSLYLSFDEVGSGGGRVVVRIPLSEIQAGTTINFQYTNVSDGGVAYGGHLTQNPLDEIFWAGQNSNSSMRVFSWQEGSNTYSWRDVGVGSWPNDGSNLTSTTPDNQDWLTKLRNFPGFAVLGSTRVVSNGANPARGKLNQVWFAWPAASGSGAPGSFVFPQPHVQWVALDVNNNFNLVTQQQIWNPSYAYSYPALAVNSNSEVGLSLEYGGGGNYENHVVGFWGDFVVYITTASTLGVTRYGDYVTIRQDAAQPARFDAWGYGMLTGNISDTHFVVFGRP